jgi:hypothetical protein
MSYSFTYAIYLAITESTPWLSIRGVVPRLGQLWTVTDPKDTTQTQPRTRMMHTDGTKEESRGELRQ